MFDRDEKQALLEKKQADVMQLRQALEAQIAERRRRQGQEDKRHGLEDVPNEVSTREPSSQSPTSMSTQEAHGKHTVSTGTETIPNKGVEQSVIQEVEEEDTNGTLLDVKRNRWAWTISTLHRRRKTRTRTRTRTRRRGRS